jgi:hypothetical protein
MTILISLLPYLIGLAIAAVLASLFGGLAAMARGGAFNARWGNRLMRARVVSQGAALALIALYFLLGTQG